MMAHKNALDMQLYLDRLSIEADVSRRLMRLPQLFGDAAVLDEAEQLTQSPKCLRAIAHLRQVLSILKDYGCADCVSIDLGLTQQANYYSGVVFHGLAAELGQPLLSGGRYDGLPAQFGRPMPATGFALSLKLTLMALERQGETFAPPVPDVILSFAPGGLRTAVAYAHLLLGQGRFSRPAVRADRRGAAPACRQRGSIRRRIPERQHFRAVRKGGVLMEQPVITFALAKGRLAEQAFDLLEQLGIDCSEARNPGRQLVLWDKEQNIRFILVKPSDVDIRVLRGDAEGRAVDAAALLAGVARDAQAALAEAQIQHFVQFAPGFQQRVFADDA